MRGTAWVLGGLERKGTRVSLNRSFAGRYTSLLVEGCTRRWFKGTSGGPRKKLPVAPVNERVSARVLKEDRHVELLPSLLTGAYRFSGVQRLWRRHPAIIGSRTARRSPNGAT